MTSLPPPDEPNPAPGDGVENPLEAAAHEAPVTHDITTNDVTTHDITTKDSASSDSPASDTAEDDEPAAWWEHPDMPWSGKPGKADMWCWGSIAGLGIYGLITLPLRPIIFAWDPYILAAFSGSRTAVITIGAGVSVNGDPLWPLALFMATLSLIKFDWIFWWAGKLWGEKVFINLTGKTKWSQNMAAKTKVFAKRFGGPAITIAYFIPFLPSAIIYAACGMSRMRLWTFLAWDALGALLSTALYMYLGYRIGEPAIQISELIAKYSNYLAIALVVFIVGTSVWNARRAQSAQSGKRAAT